MIANKFAKILTLLISLLLFYVLGNIYAVIRINELKKNAYRSHDKYSIKEKNAYARNINSKEINLYGDLCAIQGVYNQCSFSEGKRVHQFSTDQYGYKTTGDINNSNLIIIGDSFLAASGGDNMNEQFGSVIGDLKSKEVYEAAYPGNISDYNQRHLFFKEINPRAKFIYLLFEGNDFISIDSMEMEKEPKSYHRLRRYYVPVIDFLRNPFSIKTSPLSKLIYNQVVAINTKKSEGNNMNPVFVKELNSGRMQAFLKIYTKANLMMKAKEYNYISKNADTICGIVYIPTANTTYLSKESLEQKHPNLYRQFMELQKDGIDIVDLTLPFQEAAAKEQKKNSIWWSDDSHWNARGIRLGVETALNSIDYLR